MNRIVVNSNSDELESLLKRYDSLVDELKETAFKIAKFKLNVVSIPADEL